MQLIGKTHLRDMCVCVCRNNKNDVFKNILYTNRFEK